MDWGDLLLLQQLTERGRAQEEAKKAKDESGPSPSPSRVDVGALAGAFGHKEMYRPPPPTPADSALGQHRRRLSSAAAAATATKVADVQKSAGAARPIVDGVVRAAKAAKK
ncbi:hypothetical protein B0A50_00282 [Salinomyces thailandicus]|uniref:Uncharacterized protein n=1 Tax=Salinomyces thailandicus TaxID=706561 RepID=A0A4U0UH16_9PEZI|nr:hypothetical protein B0A50_00282 [Salinomyces thailandica]